MPRGPLQRQNRVLQRRRLADDRRSTAARRELLLQQDVLRHEAALLERAIDHQQKMVGVDRLREKVERAFLHRRHRVLNAAVGGHHDDRQLGIQFLRRTQHAKAIAFRQPQIGEHESGPILMHRLQRFALIPGLDHGVPLALDGQLEHRSERVFVFDEQNGEALTTRAGVSEASRRDAGAARLVLDVGNRLGLPGDLGS